MAWLTLYDALKQIEMEGVALIERGGEKRDRIATGENLAEGCKRKGVEVSCSSKTCFGNENSQGENA